MMSRTHNAPPFFFDKTLVFVSLSLLAFGLLMVASASMVISERDFGQPFHFFFRQGFFVLIALAASFCVLRVESQRWHTLGIILLLLSLLLLVAVLIPGIGHEVNGSIRWITVGPINLQVSELAKFSFVVYLAGYLVRRGDEVKYEVIGFLKPMVLLCVVAALLLLEPDYGAVAVLTATTLGMLFLAGVRVRHFILLMLVAGLALGILAVASPYRLERITTFLNPWANQFSSGYQLTQSLIAFGRGGWFGVGLGDSIQKLFYLPEAHTDFLFAVIAEELGLFGVSMVLLLFGILIGKGLMIGRAAQRLGRDFQAYLSYGFSIWLGLQVIINVGVCSGLLPTKGLTLPLLSYGGSSLLMDCLVIALLLRIDYENRLLS